MNDHRPESSRSLNPIQKDQARARQHRGWRQLSQWFIGLEPAFNRLALGSSEGQRTSWVQGYGIALLVSLGVTLIAIPLLPYLDHANIVMLFLLAVVGVAAGYGRGPAILVAVLNVLSFNYVFVPPHFAFAFETLQSILTFIVMLIVGLVVGQLTARFRYQARIARVREERACHLYEMARELSGALETEQVIEISERCVETSFRVKARLLLPDDHNRLQSPTVNAESATVDLAIAQWCFDHNDPAGMGAEALPAISHLYVPLKAPIRTRGVLVVAPEQRRLPLLPEQRRLLDTFAVLIAIALERVHFATVARDTLVKVEAERERNSLLAGLSHDLRTPMTALIGLAETLTLELIAEQSPHQEPPVGHEPVLFEKFARGHAESAAPGVGSGLAICRLIVEAHGGEIRAENRASGDASFVFTLPLETPPLVEPDDESDPESS